MITREPSQESPAAGKEGGGNGWTGERHSRRALVPTMQRKGAQRLATALAGRASRGRPGGVIAIAMAGVVAVTDESNRTCVLRQISTAMSWTSRGHHPGRSERPASCAAWEDLPETRGLGLLAY